MLPTDLVVVVFVGELVYLRAQLVEVAVEREVGLHDVLALGGQSHMTSAYSAFALRGPAAAILSIRQNGEIR